MRRNNPGNIHTPLGGYSHSLLVPADHDLLFVSGQVGIDPQGAVLSGIAPQSLQAFANLQACLSDADLHVDQIVQLTIYLTDANFIKDARLARQVVFGDVPDPACTLLVVSALARPELLIEVEALAARKPKRL
ncbi:RidA family protein [Labrenzia sp. DG1229]|uniref:RidA family protein n=1 Tax=Labrenzia sp. DG1229 TaxID=681847 RepID=UPI00048B4E87|nr:RidA family protein [Labrenzia sp. DG1229]